MLRGSGEACTFLLESSCSLPAAGGASSIWRPDQNPLSTEVGDCLEVEFARQGGKGLAVEFHLL